MSKVLEVAKLGQFVLRGATALALVASVISAVTFIKWIQIHDGIYYPAVEVGKEPLFPAGHFEFGFFIAGCLALHVAAFIGIGWLAFLRKRFPVDSRQKAVLLIVGSLLVGISAPTCLQYVFLGGLPLLAGIAALVPLLLSPTRVSLSTGSSHEDSRVR